MTSPLAKLSQAILPVIEGDLQRALSYPNMDSHPVYSRMLHYHMGWVDQDGQPLAGGAGKRIRPLLCLLVCHALAGDYRPARPPAAAVELIHNFSLLHDDIQDESPLRRNRPTVWAVWGRAQAINAGDAMFAKAHLAIPALADEAQKPGYSASMLPLLDETCLELTRGQFLDMSFEASETVTIDEHLDMIAAKTGALVGCAAQLGAVAADAPLPTQTQCREFGRSLGLAFQAVDDILDIWGKPERTGKAEAIDIIQRKKSMPVVFALGQSEELRSLYRSSEPFDPTTVRRVVGMLEQLGSRDFAHAKAEEHTRHTFETLRQFAPESEGGAALDELAAQLLNRDR